ncbi:MAG: glycosyltransferase family A protein [Oligoflexia bacterium]|nr:glycosyltransferase family A protein [Oligoflexia bacterium]
MSSIKNNQNKSIDKPASPLLSVVVSCKGAEKILSQQLKFLNKQNLTKELWQAVFIFREDFALRPVISLIKQYFPLSQIFCLKANRPLYEMRNLAFDRLDSPYLYFIDEDVILESAHHLSRLIEIHQKRPDQAVLGGSYLNHPDSTFWGDCYNWLVRLWVRAYKTKNHQDLAPAGNLSIKGYKAFKARFYSPHGFGAEELYFFKVLHKEGLLSYADKALDAPHLAQHTFKDFIQRAWIHGKSLPKQKKLASKALFFEEPAGFLIKIAGLFYLLLVRFSLIWSQLKLFVSKMA